ncbi:hypothetical protein ACI78T_14710 [Blastococcus sp. SYSU D00922]
MAEHLPGFLRFRTRHHPVRVRCRACGAPQPDGTCPAQDLCPPCEDEQRTGHRT